MEHLFLFIVIVVGLVIAVQVYLLRLYDALHERLEILTSQFAILGAQLAVVEERVKCLEGKDKCSKSVT